MKKRLKFTSANTIGMASDTDVAAVDTVYEWTDDTMRWIAEECPTNIQTTAKSLSKQQAVNKHVASFYKGDWD